MSIFGWINPLIRRREDPPPQSAAPPPLPPKPASCPMCQSAYHVDMMPIRERAVSASGEVTHYDVGQSVACFECGTVYGIVQGVGVVVRKAIAQPNPNAPRPTEPEGVSRNPQTMLDRVMEGMKWQRPDPRTPR